MSILLTGGTGYVASHTATALVLAGHQVVLLDNLCNSRRDVIDRLAQITGRDLPFVQGDVRDTELVARTLRKHACSAVLHFAGLKAVGDSVNDPLAYYANNVTGSLSVISAMESSNVRSLVFSSSATVYGEPAYLPYDESHPTAPASPYGRSKLQVEQMLADLCASNASWRVACLRYFNPVGAHQSGLIGEHPQGTPNNLLPFVARVASGEHAAVRVFGNDYATPDGTGVRDYIHVMDLAEGHVAALEFLKTRPGWHVTNLGAGRGFSVLEVIDAFEQACGKPLARQILKRRAGDLATYHANPEKALRDFGWRATRDLADICQSAWQWQQRAMLLPQA